MYVCVGKGEDIPFNMPPMGLGQERHNGRAYRVGVGIAGSLVWFGSAGGGAGGAVSGRARPSEQPSGDVSLKVT